MAGQLWTTGSLGGYMSAQKLSKELRTAVQPGLRFRQFCDVKDPDQQSRHEGAVYHWNVYSDVATAGGTLTETSTVPETNYTITQGTLTMTEYGYRLAALAFSFFNSLRSVVVGFPMAVTA